MRDFLPGPTPSSDRGFSFGHLSLALLQESNALQKKRQGRPKILNTCQLSAKLRSWSQLGARNDQNHHRRGVVFLYGRFYCRDRSGCSDVHQLGRLGKQTDWMKRARLP
jgi:hypothetical protein